MKKLIVATVAVFAAAGLAVYDLLSGWLLTAGWVALGVALALFALAWALLAVAFLGLLGERRQGRGLPADARRRGASRGLTWTSWFAVGFSVLLFANCGSGVGSGPNLHVGAMSDARLYWTLAAAFQTPLLIALVLPGVLAIAAGQTRRPGWATATIVASVFAAVVAVVSIPFAFIFGVSNCDVGTIGGCAAGVGGMTNVFVVAAIALFVPYSIMLAQAINAERATPV